jgi:eukaryotic-like serine/threonine-protein kinase
MPWPLPSDFHTVVQHPQIAFRDPHLRGCRIERNALNQPRVWSGAFAVVYKAVDGEGRCWALRAFTSESPERREHYELISSHLKCRPPSCLVDFEYREAAIRSAGDGKWYPLVVMDWVEGMTLWTWVQSKCRKGRGASVAKAARHWWKLTRELSAAEISHGDLQHANVLVTPAGRLKLVDYDGMCVPALVGRRNLEIGVRAYQHPQRNESTLLTTSLDNFSALVIYVALRALAADPSLWARYVEQASYDKLLFRAEDFVDREQSALYRDLMNSPEPAVRTLAAKLFCFARESLEHTPPLNELVGEPSRRGAPVRAASVEQPWDAQEPSVVPREKPAARVVLKVIAGPLKGRSFCAQQHSTMLVGRGTDCHIRIVGDRRISRHHFLLELVPPHARLRDLDSQNGTYVNGVKYGGRSSDASHRASDGRTPVEIDLRHGDQITAGQTVLLLHVEGVASGACASEPERPEVPCPPERAASPRVLDQLKVLAPVGRGVLGTVYKAQCRENQQTLALKIVNPAIEIGQAARRSIQHAMEPVLALRHPNLVSLLEAGQAGQAFYFVQDYCDGGNLKQWITGQGGRMAFDAARDWMLQCLDSLDYIHRQQMVHGNIKPENVLLHVGQGKRIAKLADCGLARILDQAGCLGMTATARDSDDYHFLPRERVIDFRDVRPHSDLWSLAAVFYHVLTGQFPRDRVGQEPLSGILDSDPIPIRERDPRVPEPVARAIDRALNANPGKRFQDAASMKDHLR